MDEASFFSAELRQVELSGHAEGSIAIYVDGELQATIDQAGAFHVALQLAYGEHNLVIQCFGASECRLSSGPTFGRH